MCCVRRTPIPQKGRPLSWRGSGQVFGLTPTILSLSSRVSTGFPGSNPTRPQPRVDGVSGIQADAAAGGPFAALPLLAAIEFVELHLQPRVLVDESIEPADHRGGCLSLAPSAVHDGQVVGIVSRADLLKVLRRRTADDDPRW
jgi:hypothetical protein